VLARMPKFTFFGCCCCYDSIDLDYITICCKQEGETCCCTNRGCLSVDEESLGVGCVQGDMDECCVLALFCCQMGCKSPATCVNGWSRCLCFAAAQSFPCADDKYVENCVCNFYGLACAPQCGCCPAPQHEVPTMLKSKGASEPPQGAPPASVEIVR